MTLLVEPAYGPWPCAGKKVRRAAGSSVTKRRGRRCPDRDNRDRPQELLKGFAGPRAREDISDRFSALPLLVPDRHDHIKAALLRNACRRAGVQLGTIDALLAQLCIHHDRIALTTDRDFDLAAQRCPLRVWSTNAG